jgi:hypothetical protein
MVQSVQYVQQLYVQTCHATDLQIYKQRAPPLSSLGGGVAGSI